MYFDFEDHRPDAPRLESSFSRREAIVYSVLLHVLLGLAIVYVPEVPWVREASERARLAAEERLRRLEEQQLAEEARFVFVQPRIDTPAPIPPPRAELSDQDRMAQTVERPPAPANPLPFARGNSSARVEAEPTREARGPEPVADLAQPPQQDPSEGTGGSAAALRRPGESQTVYLLPEADAGRPPPAGGVLGEALQNLQQYIQQESFNNPQGGQAPFGPSIQFDTKGVEFGPWIRRFIAQIKRNWFIPNAAMFFKGHTVLTFNVHKDGRITDLAVLQPSSVEAFNSSAVNAMLASNPTQPLPPEYPSPAAFFTVTFYFNESPSSP